MTITQPEIITHNSLDSTNEEAKRLINSTNDLQPTLITSNQQTAGKGRYDRQWISDEGNVFMSLVIKPNLAKQNYPKTSFVAALALAEEIDKYIDAQNTKFKWPNDVLIKGKKTAGILIESLNDYLIIGVGVNIKSTPNNKDLLYPATCLSENTTEEINPQKFITDFTTNLISYLTLFENKGFEQIRDHWLSRAVNLGEGIQVNLKDEKISGTFTGLDDEGALLLSVDGKERKIEAGDVFC